MEIKLPIILFGEGELCKYNSIKDAESDLEAYDIESYNVYYSLYREIKLYKKDKYNGVGFELLTTDIKYDEFIKRVKEYMEIYNINSDVSYFIKNIPIYPNCWLCKRVKVYGKKTTAFYTLDDQLEVYGNNTYRYDNDGYLIEKTTPDETTTYSYGTLGELRKVVTPTQTIEYLHNANNQRVAKKVNGEIVEKYLWANLTTLLAIYDKDDNLIQRFEYADNRMPISMTSNGQKYYLHYDQVGTLKAVSDSSLKILKEISYDTYGNILKDTNPSFKVPFGFAGGLYDQDTKLTWFGYRDYDAYTGKWTAKDPIDFAGGDSNLYGYVLGDPILFIDPDGLRNRWGGHGYNRSGNDYLSVSGYTIGAGGGGNGHLLLVGGSHYTYATTSGRMTVTCFRLGLGIYFGAGSQGMGGIDFETPSNDCNSDGCMESWAVGGPAGPTGVGITYDLPDGLSPAAGLYGGIDLCVIESCPW